MSDTASLQIGEVAKQAGVSLRTVRYYEELGLLTPSGRTSGGMRLYARADVARLRLIRHLRTFRLSLDEIRVALGVDRPPQGRQEKVSRTLEVLLMEQSRAEQEMATLTQLKAEVEEALTNVRKCTTCATPKCPESCPSREYLL